MPKLLRFCRSPLVPWPAVIACRAPGRAQSYSTAVVHSSRVIANMNSICLGDAPLGRSSLSSSADTAQLSTPEYHIFADRALDELQELLENALESVDDDDIDIDYAVSTGVSSKNLIALNIIVASTAARGSECGVGLQGPLGSQ